MRRVVAWLVAVLEALFAPGVRRRAAVGGAMALAGVSVYIGSATIPSGGPQSCPAFPSFPDASCTGVPSGTSLTAYSGANPITTNGTTIDSKTITGSLEVQATGVVITKSQINGNVDTSTGAATGAVTIQDSTIDCNRSISSANGTALLGDRFTVLRVDILDCENGSFGGTLSIEDSYLHDLYQCSTGAICDSGAPEEPHTDGLQVDPAINTTIRHNRIEGWTDPCREAITFDMTNGSCNGTTAVMTCHNVDCAAPHDVLITQNIISGGAFSLDCPIVATTNYSVTSNHFSKAKGANVGAFGLSSDCASNETWTSNTIHETAATVTADQAGPY